MLSINFFKNLFTARLKLCDEELVCRNTCTAIGCELVGQRPPRWERFIDTLQVIASFRLQAN